MSACCFIICFCLYIPTDTLNIQDALTSVRVRIQTLCVCAIVIRRIRCVTSCKNQHRLIVSPHHLYSCRSTEVNCPIGICISERCSCARVQMRSTTRPLSPPPHPVSFSVSASPFDWPVLAVALLDALDIIESTVSHVCTHSCHRWCTPVQRLHANHIHECHTHTLSYSHVCVQNARKNPGD